MADIYSRRLVGPLLITGTSILTRGVVPAGHTWVIKQLIVMNPSAGVDTALVVALQAPPAAGVVTCSVKPGVASTVFQQLMLPMTAGEVLSAGNNGTGSLLVTFCGFDFLEA